MLNCIQIRPCSEFAVLVPCLEHGDSLISFSLLPSGPSSRDILDGDEVSGCLYLLGNLLQKSIEVRARSNGGVERPVPSLEVVVGPRLDTKL